LKSQPTNPPTPAPPPDPEGLPHALTFFLTQRDRKRALAALRRIDSDRATALLSALHLRQGGDA